MENSIASSARRAEGELPCRSELPWWSDCSRDRGYVKQQRRGTPSAPRHV